MEGEVEAAWLKTWRWYSARRQPAGRVVAARRRTGGGRQRSSGPSGPVSEMEKENENGVGLGCEGHLGRIQIGSLRK
jgi:hypothetical protein